MQEQGPGSGQDAKTPYGVEVTGPGLLPTLPGTENALIFTISNRGTNADSYSLIVSSSLGWADLAKVPSSMRIEAGASARVVIPERVPQSASSGSVDTVLLTVLSRSTVPVLASGQADVWVGVADLAVAATVSPSEAKLNDPVTFTLTISNLGRDGTSARVTDTAPVGAVLTSFESGSGTCTTLPNQQDLAAAREIDCDLGFLAPGSQATITMTFRPQTAGTLTNTARVTGALPDPNPGNNRVTSTVSAAR